MTSDFGSSGLTNQTVIDPFLKKHSQKNNQTNPQSVLAGSFYLQVQAYMGMKIIWHETIADNTQI